MNYLATIDKDNSHKVVQVEIYCDQETSCGVQLSDGLLCILNRLLYMDPRTLSIKSKSKVYPISREIHQPCQQIAIFATK